MSTIETAADQRSFIPVTLDLGDVVLCPWGRKTDVRDGAVPALIAAAADPAIALWNPLRTTDEASAGAYLDRCDAGWESGNSAAFAILDGADRTLLGNTALRWVNREDGLAMIGYWLAPAARGRGAATRAVRAVTSWGIATAETRRIEIAHAAGNDASCRVAERCGFPYEGTLRASYLFGDGKYHDEHLHARLAGDPEPA
ncbi:GNAT family protein [Streptomyces sp. CB01881]|uniref:GNAT family N-acetyltransferase n=1 Tax=Streptomyces sp. CB01881 TaxID=2078691 RepID=UPI000CDC0508|nr:GNAT family protein [Streptomyces sp. CB01881]AUY48081.1 N-acetyltransferase [Streptomyces sp. CB01881]TYC76565.1 N-acetyltransferase [Streptomyces sp. CB01881]